MLTEPVYLDDAPRQPPQYVDDAPRQTSQRNVRFCGLPLTLGMTAETAVARAFSNGSSVLTTFVNPGAIHVARTDPNYRAMLEEFDMVLADGIGMVWGWRALHQETLARLSFDSSSLALPVLKRAQADGRRVMLIGGRPGVAATAAAAMVGAVPGLQLCRPQHGYEDMTTYEAVVRAERPDLIICGMGVPRQEAVLLALRKYGVLSGPAFTCGGYLDQLHGGVRYYPQLVDRLNLRWLYRLCREPRRLWRRYLLEYPEFAAALATELVIGSSGHPV